MTYQEALWTGKYVWVTGILSKSKKMHRWVIPYIGRSGLVLGESKCGRLLVAFGGRYREIRAMPAGCVSVYGTVHYTK